MQAKQKVCLHRSQPRSPARVRINRFQIIGVNNSCDVICPAAGTVSILIVIIISNYSHPPYQHLHHNHHLVLADWECDHCQLSDHFKYIMAVQLENLPRMPLLP